MTHFKWADVRERLTQKAAAEESPTLTESLKMSEYTDPVTDAELENRHTFHPVKDGQAEKYEQIRGKALEFSKLIRDLCPHSRERSLALTHMDDVVYNANASIARNS